MHYGSKGWYVKALREKGLKVHPVSHDHLSKHKGSELARLYNALTDKQSQ